MSSFLPPSRFLIPSFLVASAVCAQTAPASAPGAAGSAAPVQHLERFIVTAGADPKSEFDLAQGTAVLTGEALHHQVQPTLGQTLSAVPGVSAAAYGPGASRPLIRGLGGDRVRVLSNALGAFDASSVSPDHNTAIEPFFASSVEVLRGPSAILYGSSAVGGVVNVIDRTIPETPPEGRAQGAFELRGDTATRERTGLLAVGGGTKDLGLQLNALRRRTGDVRIPGVARIDADAPAAQVRGRLPDSATNTFSLAGGAAKFWGGGHLGAAVSHYETEYGVPTDEPGLGIDLRRTRVDFAGGLTQPFGVFRAAKARFGLGDYTHSEVVDRKTVNTTFDNRSAEGRLELVHSAIGGVTGTIGAQGVRSDFSARGAEVVTPATLTHAGAIFALEEAKLAPGLTLQLGGRLEAQKVRLGEVDPALPALPGYGARSGQRRKFSAGSGSIGVVYRPEKDWSLGAAVAYTERIPTTQELFSNGPHGATGTYEVGTTGLASERSLGFDVTLRRRTGFVTGSVSAFVNQFRNYIFPEELPANAIPAASNPDELTPLQYVGREARFHGGEIEAQFHLVEGERRQVHLALMADTVRAQQTADDQPLPRIPPVRYGGSIEYEEGRWRADLEVRRTQRQNRVAPGETPTGGYTMVNASVSYAIPAGRVSYELFARGTNLTDVTAREHASFLKEFAPLPRRGLLAGVRVMF